jgi:hypothetical protein
MAFSENIETLTILRRMSRLFSNRANATFVIEPHQTLELFAVSGVMISSLETIASYYVRISLSLVPGF